MRVFVWGITSDVSVRLEMAIGGDMDVRVFESLILECVIRLRLQIVAISA